MKIRVRFNCPADMLEYYLYRNGKAYLRAWLWFKNYLLGFTERKVK